MLGTLKKSTIGGLASPPSSSLWLLLLLVELLLLLECHAAVKESLVVYQDTTLTTSDHEVDTLSLCECRMMCLTYPPCTAVSFTNESSGPSQCLLCTDPDPFSLLQSQPRVVTLVYVKPAIPTPTTTAAPSTVLRSVAMSGAKTSNGILSNIKAVCEADGSNPVSAENFDSFINLASSLHFNKDDYMFLGFTRNNDKVDFADGSSLPWSDVEQKLDDKFKTVNINDGNDCFFREGYKVVTQGTCTLSNDEYYVVCVNV
ncbi:hypothetical protein Pmani_022668 [Petrolisthes manimaculis]|uniref:Apple domain-containing protein n=1 Tax=Petrolisthes manimaculis TaxID=1843537 RepID=A0AAE1PBC0_9EUCA|nr:hypothetical protein Pmani_022668 [Petrolisthes manimaculis]